MSNFSDLSKEEEIIEDTYIVSQLVSSGWGLCWNTKSRISSGSQAKGSWSGSEASPKRRFLGLSSCNWPVLARFILIYFNYAAAQIVDCFLRIITEEKLLWNLDRQSNVPAFIGTVHCLFQRVTHCWIKWTMHVYETHQGHIRSVLRWKFFRDDGIELGKCRSNIILVSAL